MITLLAELQKMISQCLNDDCWYRLASYLAQFHFKIIIYKEISHGVNQICSGHNFLVIPVSPWFPDECLNLSGDSLQHPHALCPPSCLYWRYVTTFVTISSFIPVLPLFTLLLHHSNIIAPLWSHFTPIWPYYDLITPVCLSVYKPLDTCL